jgi:transcriptional accessory protein Tex/SPT6
LVALWFVKDPRDVVKPGDVVRVKVLAGDLPRNRIGLSLRLDDPTEGAPSSDTPHRSKTAKRPPDRGALLHLAIGPLELVSSARPEAYGRAWMPGLS